MTREDKANMAWLMKCEVCGKFTKLYSGSDYIECEKRPLNYAAVHEECVQFACYDANSGELLVSKSKPNVHVKLADNTLWPNPKDEHNLEHKLKYDRDSLSESDYLVIASFLSAYKELTKMPVKQAAKKISLLKKKSEKNNKKNRLNKVIEAAREIVEILEDSDARKEIDSLTGQRLKAAIKDLDK